LHKEIIKYCLLFFLTFAVGGKLWSQTQDGRFVDRIVLSNNDTLRLDRTLNTWWLGLVGGVNLNHYTGTLTIPYNPDRWVKGDTNQNPLFEYPYGNGAGLFGGLRFEWLPPNKLFGGMADFKLDYRQVTAETDVVTDTTLIDPNKQNYVYQSVNSFLYFTTSLSFRYSFAIPYFYAFAGADAEIPLDYKATRRVKYEYTGDIEQDYKIEYSEWKPRLNFHLGVGYDVFVADFQHKWRAFISPFISFNFGTQVLTDFNSSWNTIMLRLGFTIKMEKDYIEADTLWFNPEAVPQPDYYVKTFDDKIDVVFGGFSEANPLPAQQLAYVEKPEIVEEISERIAVRKETDEGKFVSVGQIMPNKTQTFTFATTADTDLDPGMMAYLDRVADFLKANPNFEVRIEGHSDNTGTFEQSQRRSHLRYMSVVNYLAKKGIPKSRMPGRGRGAVVPAASNNTAAGRRANRRVEISIIEK
jgi:outer membrane protein OmpA-like peptidoglycan-associated protein